MQLPVWPSFTTAVRTGLNQSLRLWENTAFTCVGRRCVLGNSLSGIKGDSTVSGIHGIGGLFGLPMPIRESRRADSNRFPLLQLRVITQALQGCAGACKSRISRRLSLLPVAACCTVLRSRWYQIGIINTLSSTFDEGILSLGQSLLKRHPHIYPGCRSLASNRRAYYLRAYPCFPHSRG
jgi:hypothetical protein